MRMFDASSMLHAWQDYLPGQLPGLWDWLGEQVQTNEITLLSEAFGEVEHKAPDCAQWLRVNGLQVVQVTQALTDRAMQIKQLLGISNDSYHPRGVDENDILIVAAAWVHAVDLVSNEERQPLLPDDKRKYKIPAVCALPEVAVRSLSLREFLAQSGQVFG